MTLQEGEKLKKGQELIYLPEQKTVFFQHCSATAEGGIVSEISPDASILDSFCADWKNLEKKV